MVGGHQVVLVDTPGFDDTTRSDCEVLETIGNWLRTSYEQQVFLRGIIYLQDISQPRVRGNQLKSMRMFRSLTGKENMDNVVLLTTMWDKVSDEKGTQFERELTRDDDFWGGMVVDGAKVLRHDGTRRSAERVVLDLIGKSAFATRFQREVAAGKSFLDTGAGEILGEELKKQRREYEQHIQDLKEEMRFANERSMSTCPSISILHRKLLTRHADKQELKAKLEAQHARVVESLRANEQQTKRLLEEKINSLQVQISGNESLKGDLEAAKIQLEELSETVRETDELKKELSTAKEQLGELRSVMDERQNQTNGQYILSEEEAQLLFSGASRMAQQINKLTEKNKRLEGTVAAQQKQISTQDPMNQQRLPNRAAQNMNTYINTPIARNCYLSLTGMWSSLHFCEVADDDFDINSPLHDRPAT
jgi:myosin heavy subunit